PPLVPDPPRKQRQEHTVYNQKQYPNYNDLLKLARHSVWFKNRRAKLARVRRLQQQPQRVPGRRGRGARAAPLVLAAAASAPQPGPSGILPAAEPTICSLDQAWGGPGCRAQKGIPAALSPGPGPVPAPIPGPAQVPGPIPGPISGPVQIPGPAQIPGPISGPISSPNPGLIPGQISGPGPIIDPIPGPAQIPGPGRLRGPGPILSPGRMRSPGSLPGLAPILGPGPGSGSASIPGPGSLPAPAPLWPQSPDASDFLPDTQLFPHFTELLPPLDPLEGSSVSTMTSQYQEGDDSMGKKDSGSQHQDEGGSVNENHSGPRSLLDL
uniref:Tetrapeptide repeat homeobox 1 n=1 Tax=Nomascus leucogenys TaxID=61853 RepID=G1QT36_NOMLE